MNDADLCVCRHPRHEHVPILGCCADVKPKDGVGVEFACACEAFTAPETETETTESYPLSLGD